MKYDEADRLTCIKGYSHPNMGRLFVKNRKYYIYPYTAGKNMYIVANRNDSLICGEKFVDEHFIKEEK